AGARSGLFVLLRSYERNLDYICKGPVQGFKILLHHPAEIPQLSKEYFRVPLLQEVLVSVRPNMITTSVGLLDYTPNRRQCFFASERYLRFFKVYTQRNCELECLANYTLKACGCVRFSMPRVDETAICGHRQMTCYNKAEHDLLHEQYLNGITKNISSTHECECLPACTSIKYDAEISQASFDWSLLLNAFKSSTEYPGMCPARLAIFFKENQFITTERSELYGPTDFLANCGGLLGLFMGVSLLSFVEILYHITLRLCCNLRKNASSKDTS
ncbi:Pickpocket protein 28, partial [Pseudolycoriella hygida]